MDVESGPPAGLTKTAQSVFQTLMVAGPMSRAELSRRLSLSAAALTKITRPLLAADLFVEVDSGEPGTAGRPPQPLDVNVDFAHFVGVKLTGGTVFAVATDARGRILQDAHRDLSSTAPEDVADQIAGLVRQCRAVDPGIAGIGVALSGNASRGSPVVRKSPFLHWQNVPFGDLVAQRTGLPVTLENDVRAVTAAEQWFGEADQADSFVLLTFGAGIGCGIVANGQQLEGHDGASGLIGHTRIDDSGPMCYAGHTGCAHAYATIDGLRIRIAQALGRPVTFAQCLELEADRDPAALAAFDAAGRAIGTLIAMVINMIGPDRVVISGEGLEIYLRSRDSSHARLRDLLHWTATEVPIGARPCDFSQWARGAAVVAIQEHVRGLVAGDTKRRARVPRPTRIG